MKPKKAIAVCDFQHKNVDYRSGETVELDNKELNALSRAGLVKLCVDGSVPAEPEPKDNETIVNEQNDEGDLATQTPNPQEDGTPAEPEPEHEPVKQERKGAKK